MLIEAIVDLKFRGLSETYTYKVPPELEGEIKVGIPVKVPFGRGNSVKTAYVMKVLKESSLDPEKIKSVLSLDKGSVETDEDLIELAAWIKDTYGASYSTALRTVMPVKDKVKEKTSTTVTKICSNDDLKAFIEIFEMKSYTARLRLAEYLLDKDSFILEEAEIKISKDTLKYFSNAGLIEIDKDRLYRNIDASGVELKENILSPEQKEAFNSIIEYNKNTKDKVPVSLIYGVTGSGKTSVYIELIKETVKQGKEAILLIPEISLTYQTVNIFKKHFGDRLSIINSRLSNGERFDRFEQAKKGLIDVMIGPRSALFTPFKNLGIIIIDEEHDGAYKSDRMPKYRAVDVAEKRASMCGASVVLGSATPSLESFYNAEQGIYNLVTLTKRYNNALLPEIIIEDMRDSEMSGNLSMLSKNLAYKIQDRLEKNEQILLFLNRRGLSSYVMCRSCGHVVKCPHCSVSLSLHNDGMMKCHYCGYMEKKITKCPECGSEFIDSFKSGIQQVERELNRFFPSARIIRMDADTTRKKNSFDELLSEFSSHNADILLGTQMIVKGHDFPDVTLVGILSADQGLNIPEFDAAERNFQLITQAAGRAGRAEKKGEVIIQTYNPEHYSIEAAKNHDYDSFYKEEIFYRKVMGYPPFANMLTVKMIYSNEDYLKGASEFMEKYLKTFEDKFGFKILGPVEPLVSKIKDNYILVFHIRHINKKALIWLREKIEKYVSLNRGYRKIAFEYDLI